MAETDPRVVVCVWRWGEEELTGAQIFRNTSAFSGRANRSTGVKSGCALFEAEHKDVNLMLLHWHCAKSPPFES